MPAARSSHYNKFSLGKKYELRKWGGGHKYEFQIYYTPLLGSWEDRLSNIQPGWICKNKHDILFQMDHIPA